MNKPMTTEELFNKICNILKEKGRLPDILEYESATRNSVPVTTYEYELGSKLAYGGNEGIYLDLWIEYSSIREKPRQKLGEFKTLHESNDAMRTMAGLLADFIIEESAYVNAHLDDFTWEGVDIYAFDKDGKQCGLGFTYSTMEDALTKKDRLLEKYPKVVVRDNATRKEKTFLQEPNSSENDAKKFCITVTETLRKEIILKSDSLEQAVSNVEQAYADGRIVLDADDLVCDPVTGETRRIERSGFYTDEQVQRMEVSSFGNQL